MKVTFVYNNKIENPLVKGNSSNLGHRSQLLVCSYGCLWFCGYSPIPRRTYFSDVMQIMIINRVNSKYKVDNFLYIH